MSRALDEHVGLILGETGCNRRLGLQVSGIPIHLPANAVARIHLILIVSSARWPALLSIDVPLGAPVAKVRLGRFRLLYLHWYVQLYRLL